MNINYLGNDGTQCGVINSLDAKQVALFEGVLQFSSVQSLSRIRLSATP